MSVRSLKSTSVKIALTGGPQGPQGPQGATGPQGSTGPQGEAAPTTLEETTTRTANYTLALADAGKVVPMNGSSLTVEVPLNSSVAFPTGSVVNVYNLASTAVTIAGASGVTVRNAGSVAEFGEVSLRKRGTDEWVVAGNVS